MEYSIPQGIRVNVAAEKDAVPLFLDQATGDARRRSILYHHSIGRHDHARFPEEGFDRMIIQQSEDGEKFKVQDDGIDLLFWNFRPRDEGLVF